MGNNGNGAVITVSYTHLVLEFLRLQNEYKASLKVIPILAQKARVTTATLKRIIYDLSLIHIFTLQINIIVSTQSLWTLLKISKQSF